jgi:hypothetical protein
MLAIGAHQRLSNARGPTSTPYDAKSLVLLGKGQLFGVPVIPGAAAGPSSAIVPLSGR